MGRATDRPGVVLQAADPLRRVLAREPGLDHPLVVFPGRTAQGEVRACLLDLLGGLSFALLDLAGVALVYGVQALAELLAGLVGPHPAPRRACRLLALCCRARQPRDPFHAAGPMARCSATPRKRICGVPATFRMITFSRRLHLLHRQKVERFRGPFCGRRRFLFAFQSAGQSANNCRLRGALCGACGAPQRVRIGEFI
jgi:hypothetical protein